MVIVIFIVLYSLRLQYVLGLLRFEKLDFVWATVRRDYMSAKCLLKRTNFMPKAEFESTTLETQA